MGNSIEALKNGDMDTLYKYMEDSENLFHKRLLEFKTLLSGFIPKEDFEIFYDSTDFSYKLKLLGKVYCLGILGCEYASVKDEVLHIVCEYKKLKNA